MMRRAAASLLHRQHHRRAAGRAMLLILLATARRADRIMFSASLKILRCAADIYYAGEHSIARYAL